jgi:two-component system chemotaxis sensor kinase CheA
MVRPDGDPRSCFLDEAMEAVAELESTLLRLEKTPDDLEAVRVLGRIVEDLKERGALMGLAEMARFIQAVEGLLDQLRRGVRSVTPLVVDALLASVDVLRRLITQIAADPDTPTSPDENVERVRGLIASLVEESRPLSAHLPRPV